MNSNEEKPGWIKLAEELNRKGMQYYKGRGAVCADWQRECVVYFLAAADRGHAKAQYMLGEVYQEAGHMEMAQECFEKAARMGYTEAMHQQGRSRI